MPTDRFRHRFHDVVGIVEFAQTVAEHQQEALPGLVALQECCRLRALEGIPGSRRDVLDERYVIRQPRTGLPILGQKKRPQPTFPDQGHDDGRGPPSSAKIAVRPHFSSSNRLAKRCSIPLLSGLFSSPPSAPDRLERDLFVGSADLSEADPGCTDLGPHRLGRRGDDLRRIAHVTQPIRQGQQHTLATLQRSAVQGDGSRRPTRSGTRSGGQPEATLVALRAGYSATIEVEAPDSPARHAEGGPPGRGSGSKQAVMQGGGVGPALPHAHSEARARTADHRREGVVVDHHALRAP